MTMYTVDSLRAGDHLPITLENIILYLDGKEYSKDFVLLVDTTKGYIEVAERDEQGRAIHNGVDLITKRVHGKVSVGHQEAPPIPN